MSAWIVSEDHIAYLVTGAVEFGVAYNGVEVTPETAQDIGQTLWAENHISVHTRYEGRHGYDGIAPEYHHRWAEVEPVNLHKQIACYSYQTCETEDYESRAWFRFCADLTAAICDRLGGTDDQIRDSSKWDSAPWGI